MYALVVLPNITVAMATYGAVNPFSLGYSSVTDAFFDTGETSLKVGSGSGSRTHSEPHEFMSYHYKHQRWYQLCVKFSFTGLGSMCIDGMCIPSISVTHINR